METFTIEVRPWAGQLRTTIQFKYITPIINVYPDRQDKLTYIIVQSPDKIDIKESYVLLETVKTIVYNATNSIIIPTMTIQVPEFEAIEIVGNGKPIIPILYNDDDENVDWHTTVFCNKDVLIELSYETLFYSNIEHGRARFYRLRNLGNVLSIGFRFFKPLTIVDAFKYAYLATFVVHQICNGRFTGLSHFEKIRDIEILDNVEKPFDPTPIREMLKEFSCAACSDFTVFEVEDINDMCVNFCKSYPKYCD